MSESQAIDYEAIFQHAPVGMCISQHRVIHACNGALVPNDPHRSEERR